MEVMHILESKTYELTDDEKIPAIRNWLGEEGLQHTKTIMNEKKEK